MCSARSATLSASFMNALNLTHRFHRRPWTLSAITDESDFRSCKSHRGQPSGALVEYLNTPRIRLARHLKRTLVTYSAQAVHSRTDRRQSLDMPPMPHSPAFAMIHRCTSHITHGNHSLWGNFAISYNSPQIPYNLLQTRVKGSICSGRPDHNEASLQGIAWASIVSSTTIEDYACKCYILYFIDMKIMPVKVYLNCILYSYTVYFSLLNCI